MDVQAPILNGDQLSEEEQAVLGGFMKESSFVDLSTQLIQCEVPLGLQRLSEAIERVEGEEHSIETDYSLDQILSQHERTGTLEGFVSNRELSPQEQGGASADAIVVNEDEIGIVELKTEGIDGLNDTHQGFGQLVLYQEMLGEDYPSLLQEMSLSLFLVVGEWDNRMAPELVAPTYRKRGINVFDVSSREWVIEAGQAASTAEAVLDRNPDTLRNYDVPLAIVMTGNARTSDLARAREIMDNIDPYKELDPDDFEKFDDTPI